MAQPSQVLAENIELSEVAEGREEIGKMRSNKVSELNDKAGPSIQNNMMKPNLHPAIAEACKHYKRLDMRDM